MAAKSGAPGCLRAQPASLGVPEEPPGWRLSCDVGGLGLGGAWTGAPLGSPQQEQVQVLPRGEQGSSGAPFGCFPSPVSLKNPQNPTGDVRVWAAVTLKGFHNRSLEEAARPAPGPQWLKGQDKRDQPPRPDILRAQPTPHTAPGLLIWKLRPKEGQRPPQDLPGKSPQLCPGGHSPGPRRLRQTSLRL